MFAVWTPDTLRGEAAWAACLRVLRFAREQEERFLDSFSVIRDLAGLDAAFGKGGLRRYSGAGKRRAAERQSGIPGAGALPRECASLP